MEISIVIPLYKCSKNLEELNTRLLSVLKSLTKDFEIIYVNDASPENDWIIVKRFAQKNKRIKGINLSRNFGQHAAITVGLQAASGNWIVVMDGDLQDQPEEIPKFYDKTHEGFDIVLGQRTKRNDKWLKKFYSKIFYRVFSYLTDTVQDPSIGNFGVYNKKVIHAVLSMQDYYRFFPTMVQWVGFNITKVPIRHEERKHGTSAYSFGKMLKLAFSTIIAFSNKPLWLTVKLGILISTTAFVMGIDYLIRYFSGKIIVTGYTSLILSIWLLSGIIIIILGILGIYIGNIFDKAKNRPIYIKSESINI
jgi:polyisoprenyl-phosphate glycosyltransferase